MHQFGDPAMVPRTHKPLCQGTSADATGKRISDKPKMYCPPIHYGELIDTSGLVGFRKALSCKGISKTLLKLSQILDEKVRSPVKSQPGENGLAGVLIEKLILFMHVYRL